MVGGSQAGWIVPLAAARFEHALAFTAMVDAPAISYGEEQLDSKLTGEEGGMPSGLSSEEIDQRLDEAGARRVWRATLPRADDEPRALALRRARPSRSPRVAASPALEHLTRTCARKFTTRVFPQAGTACSTYHRAIRAPRRSSSTGCMGTSTSAGASAAPALKDQDDESAGTATPASTCRPKRAFKALTRRIPVIGRADARTPRLRTARYRPPESG
jgi:hypothetical protein